MINNVVLNIINSMKRKIDKYNPWVENILLLICKDIEVSSHRCVLKKHKGKKQFTVSYKLLKYEKYETLKVFIMVDIKVIILKKMILLN